MYRKFLKKTSKIRFVLSYTFCIVSFLFFILILHDPKAFATTTCKIHQDKKGKGFYLSINEKKVYSSDWMSTYRSNYDNVFETRSDYISKGSCLPIKQSKETCEILPKIKDDLVSGYFLKVHGLTVVEESRSSNNFELINRAMELAQSKEWCTPKKVIDTNPCTQNALNDSLPLTTTALRQVKFKEKIIKVLKESSKIKLKPKVKLFSSNAIFKKQLDYFLGYYYKAKKPKGLIVYIHGGGCKNQDFSPRAGYLDPILTQLFKNDYSILTVDYRELPGTLVNFSCKQKVALHLKRLEEVSLQVKGISRKIPIIFYGHSYGGYLVNLLSTRNTLLDRVDAFISYAGIWNPKSHSSTASADFDPLQNITSQKFKPLLVLHSQDDKSVPIAQANLIKKIINSNKLNNPQVVTFKKGGHYPIGNISIQNSIVEKIKKFINDTIK